MQDYPTFVTHLECALTGEMHAADQVQSLSKAGKPLLVRYDLAALAQVVEPEQLAQRRGGFWRYREFLPLRRSEHLLSLGEVTTPLIPLDRLAARSGGLWVKEEGCLPTGSFKARGLGVAVSMAKALGLTHLAMPSNGNAGAALAAYARRGGLRATVLCPEDTPPINLAEIALQGAEVYAVNGLINDCGKIVAEGREKVGWFDLSTLKEPYRIEGKKTMGLELAEQLGWRLPDVIFYPTGGGTGLIGMWKAFAELEAIGWIAAKRPRLVAVQASGCAPIVRAYDAGAERAEPWEDAQTFAAGIRVPAAIGDFLILQALRASQGFAIAVDDAAISAARDRVAQQEGLLLCPEGAACYAAYRQALDEGRVSPDEEAIVFNCATGLKYPLPSAGKPLDRRQAIGWQQFL